MEFVRVSLSQMKPHFQLVITIPAQQSMEGPHCPWQVWRLWHLWWGSPILGCAGGKQRHWAGKVPQVGGWSRHTPLLPSANQRDMFCLWLFSAQTAHSLSDIIPIYANPTVFNSHPFPWLFDLSENKTQAVCQRGVGFSSSETTRQMPLSQKQAIAADCQCKEWHECVHES